MHETSAPVAEAPAATPYVYNGTELYHIDQFLQYAQSAEASDVHLCTGAAPTWRRNGNLEPMFPDAAPLEPEHTWMIALSFLTPEQAAQVTGRGDIDWAEFVGQAWRCGCGRRAVNGEVQVGEGASG